MTLQEIQSAVLAGQKVHWQTKAYEIIHDQIGQWLVVCRSTGGCWGLVWSDKTTMNGKPWDFFVG
jgi:hypothetical protein